MCRSSSRTGGRCKPIENTRDEPGQEARGPVVLWFRRDLRLSDHPALAQAARQGPVTALFVLDDLLVRTAGQPRLRYFMQTLRALDLQLRAVGGALTVRAGRPEHVVPAVATEVQARAVHITADFAPYGSDRDQRVAKALGAVPLIATGSPYAAAPGEVVKPDGRPYEVFTPFYRSWLAHELELPVPLDLASITWRPLDGLPVAERSGAGSDLAGGGRARGASGLGAVSNDTPRHVRDHSRSPCARRDVAPLAVPQGRGAPPSHPARRSRAGRRRLSSRARMA